jgi:D-aminopeptidase
MSENMGQKRIEDYGIHIGELQRGRLNKISDVPGVRVGHCTIDTGRNKTGVTVVTWGEGSLSAHRLAAGCHVLNGYGKTTGLVQIDELGTLESPIALTNTLNVGLVHDALVEHLVTQARQQQMPLTSVNPVVCECNDAYLNDIQQRAVRQEHVFQALADARPDFAEGDIGAGKGMSCHQLKGGIGSASRVVDLDGKSYTLGVLVLSNYGMLHDLTIQGYPLGRELEEKINVHEKVEHGSIIMVIATDVPLSDRQIRRVCRRAGVGLARLGSFMGHGSGDIALGFSTANHFSLAEKRDILPVQILREERLDGLFRAAAEATEEAVLNSMITARRTVGWNGNVRESLQDYIKLIAREV